MLVRQNWTQTNSLSFSLTVLWKWLLHYQVSLPYPLCSSPLLNSGAHSAKDPSFPLFVAITRTGSPPLPPNPIVKRKVQPTRSSTLKMKGLQEGMLWNPNRLLLKLLAFLGEIKRCLIPRISRCITKSYLFLLFSIKLSCSVFGTACKMLK